MSIKVGDQVLVNTTSVGHFVFSSPSRRFRDNQVGRVVVVIPAGSQPLGGYELEFPDGERLRFFDDEVVKTAAQELIDVHRDR